MPDSRKDQLLELTHDYVRQHGLADLSLRPLAAAVGSSPRVLLFLFGSKDGLVKALLERARDDELRLLRTLPEAGLIDTAHLLWGWLRDPGHRGSVTLWAEAYARSLVARDEVWAGFAERTVNDWLGFLAARQDDSERGTTRALAVRTAVLMALRGALLDLLATGDDERVTAALECTLHGLAGGASSPRGSMDA
ncbi:TetR/AcrR family transcriptional regulator [Kineosporia sp. J2-2]|uniref:TetR/AcrR family transcriptional regulator n=1 Tax=Kineosporia corallincola TaxID=2835133 RepID=A0ABS5TGT0_9ACTN|nr:TetR family transcriptional regulator [Kineosporia corallincola]MBT0769589.1 TetR/AcrR family transcriptional regulator [Kineosporia corallincola]